MVRPERWLAIIRRYALNDVPAGGLRTRLLPHVRLHAWQLEPTLAAVRHGAVRILIADGVGLGKTLQAGLLIAETCRRSSLARALVLVPAGLRLQWQQELKHHFDLQTCHADASWLAAATRSSAMAWNPWSLPGVYVSSHDFVKRPEVRRPLETVTWDVVVVDEAHAASLQTDRRAAVDAIARRARKVVLLTATPHDDDPYEFQALCRIGALERDDPLVVFRRRREDVAAGPSRRSKLLVVRPAPAERRMHELLNAYTQRVWIESNSRGDDKARLLTIVLRKRALSSASSLLRSVRRRMDLLVTPVQAAGQQLFLPLADEDPLPDDDSSVLGWPGLADPRRERRWLASIAEAARNAAGAETKLACLLRLLRRLHEPAIVFTEYRDTLSTLERVLASRGLATLSLHGGLTPFERSEVQRAFNSSDTTLLATDAASEGLNLHSRCRLIVHYELPWSTLRLEQRAGRVDRLGQTRPVHEIALIAGDTAEALVLAPLLGRALRAVATGRPTAGLSASLSESRVAALIIGSAHEDGMTTAHAADLSLRQAVAHNDGNGSAPPQDLKDAAAAEVIRQGRIRALTPRAIERPWYAPIAPVQTIMSSSRRLREGFYSIYSITLRTRTGSLVCATSSVVYSKTPQGAADVTARPSANGAACRDHAIRSIVARILDDATVVLARTATAARRREEAIGRGPAGAPRALVQSSLFDRRAAREAADRERVALALREETEQRLWTDDGEMFISVDVQLVGLLQLVRRVDRS